MQNTIKVDRSLLRGKHIYSHENKNVLLPTGRQSFHRLQRFAATLLLFEKKYLHCQGCVSKGLGRGGGEAWT